MIKSKDYFRDEKAASGRQLVLMFLAAVAVCAVFFSLGFVVGYNRAPSKQSPVTENVGASGEIPPTVNSPAGAGVSSSAQYSSLQTESVTPAPASVPPPQRPHPLTPESAEKDTPPTARIMKSTPPKVVAKSKPVAAPQSRPAKPAPADSSSHFAVQVMASRTQADADNLLNLLKSRGYPVYILNPDEARSRDKLYRVQVGPFVTRVAADTTRDKLMGEGFRPFVVH
ncbi:MAG TPA: SPOR domain-containing protein [Terriglobia bacterium]|nr:SPOR domain-containing protein [Terriglobia bacterium]